jgi:uncharacterized protein (DUF1684 family)
MIEIEMQDHHSPRLGFETRQEPVEQVALGHLDGRILRDRIVDRGELDLDHAAPAPADELETRVRDQAVEPVVEGRGIAQSRQAAPRTDQGLLDGVLGEIRVAKDEAGRGVQSRTGSARELGEGMPVAVASSRHESVLVHVGLGSGRRGHRGRARSLRCRRWSKRFQLRARPRSSATTAYHRSMTDEHEHHEHHADHNHRAEHGHHAEHEHHEHRHEPIDYVEAVEGFRADKDHYFKHGAGSPIPVAERDAFAGLPYFAVDPALRFEGLELAPYAGSEPQRFQIPTSDGRLRPAHRVGSLRFDLGGEPRSLAAYVVDSASGHVHVDEAGADADAMPSIFVPFLDATSGRETYGAGRYLDIEPEDDGTYSLDFNLAYHPSCVYDIGFSCPLTPAENRLPVRIEAGERLAEGGGSFEG